MGRRGWGHGDLNRLTEKSSSPGRVCVNQRVTRQRNDSMATRWCHRGRDDPRETVTLLVYLDNFSDRHLRGPSIVNRRGLAFSSVSSSSSLLLSSDGTGDRVSDVCDVCTRRFVMSEVYNGYSSNRQLTDITFRPLRLRYVVTRLLGLDLRAASVPFGGGGLSSPQAPCAQRRTRETSLAKRMPRVNLNYGASFSLSRISLVRH